MTAPGCRYFAIVPAAGRSVRMGQPKLLLPWRDTTVIQQTLRAWQDSPVHHIIVVVNREEDALRALIRSTAADVAVPPTPPPEMKSSVQFGLQFARDIYSPSDRDAWLLAPADTPLLSSAVIRQLVDGHERRGGQILVPRHQGRPGHPVLFPWPLAECVERLGPQQGVNALVRQGPTTFVDTDDPGILSDLDTPADYEYWRQGGSNSRPGSGGH